MLPGVDETCDGREDGVFTIGSTSIGIEGLRVEIRHRSDEKNSSPVDKCGPLTKRFAVFRGSLWRSYCVDILRSLSMMRLTLVHSDRLTRLRLLFRLAYPDRGLSLRDGLFRLIDVSHVGSMLWGRLKSKSSVKGLV